MLKHLSIQNYALIDKLDIAFGDGLSILTGETGAGKSIILGALSLILGKRADTSVLMDEEKKCIIEATFDVSRYGLKGIFQRIDADYDDLTVVRREINAGGKSRAFINDTPVNLPDLKELVSFLIDIHSQHQTLELGSAAFQLKALDHYAGLAVEAKSFNEKYHTFRGREQELKKLVEMESNDKAQLDYIAFQFNELESAGLKEGEEEELAEELNTLAHVEEVKQLIQSALMILNEGDSNLLSSLDDAVHSIHKAAGYYQKLEKNSERIESASIELKDITVDLERLQEALVYDPERLEFLRERTDLVNGLCHKHKVSSVRDLLELKESFNQQLSGVFDKELLIKKIEKEVTALRQELTNLATLLSDKRKKVIPAFETEILALLKELGMKESTFIVQIRPMTDFSENGTDEVGFLFSANKGIPPMEMGKVASGGELSRLMLSLKSVIAQKLALPSIVFDEIDAGISGEIADKTGTIVKRIASGTQVICITHLPQMASKGDFHFLVYKDTTFQPPKTNIRPLSGDERINEIAKMLSGEQLTRQAIENAKVLLNA